MTLVYICREHRERGDASCTNTTGVPAAELHKAVIDSMRASFTPETFRAHLAQQAANVEARDQRAAERANLLAELPKLAAATLVKRIATVEDDALVAALKDEWSTAKVSRELAERRVVELEGIERDLTADTEEVEALIATWRTWGETLACTQGAADGSIPAELQAQARQILKRLLVTTILVKPNEPGDWSFGAYTRFEGLLMGGLNHGKVTLYQWEGEPGGFFRDPTMDSFIGPIAGGSDAGGSAVRDTEMAPIPPIPHTPQYPNVRRA